MSESVTIQVVLAPHLSDVVLIVSVVARHVGRHLELGLHTLRLRLRSAEAVGIVVWSST